MAEWTEDEVRAMFAEEQEFRELKRTRVPGERDLDRSLYANLQHEPTMKVSYIVYLDVLGTKEAIMKLTDDDLRVVIEERDQFLGRLYDPERGNWGRMVSFTDNLVYGEPAQVTENGELLSLAMAIAGYQSALTVRGRFLRGGLVRGLLYIDSTFATGKGLLHAIELEERKAVYPRVLLSRNALPAIADEADKIGPSAASPHNHYFLLDADGETFVNYLASAPANPVRADHIGISHLGLVPHKSAVEDALVEHEEPGRVREKILWAAHLHNWLCDETSQTEWKIHTGLSNWERRNPRRFEWIFGRPPQYAPM